MISRRPPRCWPPAYFVLARCRVREIRLPHLHYYLAVFDMLEFMSRAIYDSQIHLLSFFFSEPPTSTHLDSA
jgi:hypothetical protein